MAVEVFADCVFFLKVNHLPAQDKKRLKKIIKDKGGTISFVLNNKCTHVIAENADVLPARHLQNIKKNHIPIVGVDFIMNLANKIPGSCGEVLSEKLDTSSEPATKNKTPSQDKEHGKTFEESAEKEKKKPKKRVCIEIDPDRVNFHQDFEVAKYAAFEKALSSTPKEVAVIELQCLTGQFDLPFQIAVHLGLSNGVQSKLNYIQFETSEEACKKYHHSVEDLKKKGYKLRKGVPQNAVHLTSEKLQEMLLQDAINATTVSPEISTFVGLIWTEALGHLDHILLQPVNSISLNDVSKAEGILLQVRKALDREDPKDTLIPLMSEFYRIIRHKNEKDLDINKKLLSSKETLCQVIRDIASICETNLSSTNPPSLAKYHALRCMIQDVNTNSDEFLQVKEQVLQNNHSGIQMTVLNIYRVGRMNEAAEFESSLGNIQLLLHASASCNYVGILSRGLLLPKVVVEDHGVERTDIGNLGSGIYFSDSISTSMKYSAPTQTDGSRLLVIFEVALGNCLDLNKKDFSLTSPPPGYHSVHGIRKAPGLDTDFEDDEYVVYNTSQIRMKYVVQFCTTEDNIKEFCPTVNMAEQDENLEDHSDLPSQTNDDTILDIKPLKDMKTGLLDNSGNPIPLEGIHIKGKILDLISQVVVFQRYTNRSTVPIEAKYVFPLDSTAAVCGFEAFINGKHIIGEVKEKEEAHREYREAVSKGHGAYLMDQDAPDVFTVSVGNLPPQATVIIKITYVTELSIDFPTVEFTISGAVMQWQEDNALNENTQDTVEKICIKECDAKKCVFSLDLSIEMPFKIERIYSTSHKIKSKKTDCKAVISTEDNSTLDIYGFSLQIDMTEIYLPRMWVEKHPEKESEACMLVFQPDFNTESEEEEEEEEFNEVIICLDCSNSMSSVFQQAKQIALFALDELYGNKSLNIIKFGTSYEEFCSCSRRYTDFEKLKKFIKSAKPTMGNTDFWKPLHSLSLLVPSKGRRNILLISDGHIQNESRTFQIVKNNVKHTRLFTCGVGSTVNRHMLRSLAKYGTGAFEYFDANSKYNWHSKVRDQISRTASEGCTSVSVKWQQFNRNAPEPIKAPAEIQSIFKYERVIVYGFAPHCTQATLKALLHNQEIETMVSTTELQKTKGTILHKLTARAIIRDYEDGILHEKENEHEMRKQMLKSMIIELSKEYSIVTQFTSFVAIEKRDAMESQVDNPDILQLMAAEDVDILPYMTWGDDHDERDREEKLMDCKLHLQSADLSSSSSSDDFGLNVCFEEEAENEKSAESDYDMEVDGEEDLGCPALDDDFLMEDYSDLLEVAGEVCVEAPEGDARQLQSKQDRQSLKKRKTMSYWGEPSSSPAAEGLIELQYQILSEPAPPPSAPSQRFLSSIPPPPPPPPPGLLEPLRDAAAPRSPSYHPTAPQALPCLEAAPPMLAARRRTQPSEVRPSLEFSAPLQADVQMPRYKLPSLKVASVSSKDMSIDTCYADAFFIEPEPPVSYLTRSMPCPARPMPCSFGPAPSAGPAPDASVCENMTNRMYAMPIELESSSWSSFFSPSKAKTMAFTALGTAGFGSTKVAIPHLQRRSARPNSACGAAAVFTAQQMASSAFGTAGFGSTKMASSAFGTAGFGSTKMTQIGGAVTEIDSGLFGKTSAGGFGMGQMAFGTGFGSTKMASPAFGTADFGRAKSDQDGFSVPKLILKYKADPNWAHLFLLQTQDHYWELDSKLEMALKVDVNFLINVFLAEKGLNSLGPKGKENVLRLIATLLVLQVLRQAEELSGIRFKSLMMLDESSIKTDNYWRLSKATQWARNTDRQYPGICGRLDLDKDWNSATRKLLGIDPIEDNSPLTKAVHAC